MAKYTLDCDMDHEPMHFEVEAESDDEAMTKMLAELQPHADEHHPEMASKSPEEMKAFVESKWHKED